MLLRLHCNFILADQYSKGRIILGDEFFSNKAEHKQERNMWLKFEYYNYRIFFHLWHDDGRHCSLYLIFDTCLNDLDFHSRRLLY